MAILDNNPSFTYVKVQNLVVIFDGKAYTVNNMYTNEKYIYWDSKTPNVLITTEVRLQENSSRFLIVINDRGMATTVPHDELTLSFENSPNFGGGSVSADEFNVWKQQVTDNSEKYNVVLNDVDGLKRLIGDETTLKDGTLIQNINTTKETATSVEAEIREIQNSIKDDYKEVRDELSKVLIAYSTGLSELNTVYKNIARDNEINAEEMVTLDDSMNVLRQQYADIDVKMIALKKILQANGMDDYISRVDEYMLKVNTSMNNLLNTIDTAVSDGNATPTEMTIITQMVSTGAVDISDLKALVDEIVSLGLGGTVYEEFSKLNRYKDLIEMQVGSVEKTTNEVKETFTEYKQTTDSISSTITQHTTKLNGLETDFNDIKSKVNKSVQDVVYWYYASTSQLLPEGGEWITTVPPINDGEYLWYKTQTLYNDGTSDETDPVRIGGEKGETGVGIARTETWYYSSTSRTTTINGTWTKIRPEFVSGRHIWTRLRIYYTNNTYNDTTEICSTGEEGINAKSLQLKADSYVVPFIENEPKDSEGIITLTAVQQNITSEVTWSISEVIDLVGTGSTRTIRHTDFLDYDSVTITVTCEGLSDSVTIAKVLDGNSAYTIILSNESHTFKGDTDSAIAQSTTCDVIAYKGTERVPATIGTITGMPIGMTIPSHSNNGTITSRFTVNVTTSMTQEFGTLNVPITVDGIEFNKTFSYSLALKGLDVKSLELYTNRYAVAFDKDNNVKDSSNIVLTALMKNITGDVVWGVSPNDITLIDVPGVHKKEINPNDFKNVTSATVSISSNTYSDTVTIVKVQDGLRGEDGTSIHILGSYDSLEDLNNATIDKTIGDAYVVQGDLHVWDGEKFDNVGRFKGEDAYSIILTNDTHAFNGENGHATIGSTTCKVLGFKGTTQIPVTIGTITGMPTGMTIPAHTNNGTLNSTFTVNVNEQMTTSNGTLSIPITMDGESFTKIFSYTLALNGTDGVGVIKTDIEYIQTDSNKIPPDKNDPNWDTNAPEWIKGKYLWQRVKTYYTNNNIVTSEPAFIGGEQGEPARYIKLNPSTPIVAYDYGGTLKDNTEIEIVATLENFDDTITWTVTPSSVTLISTDDPKVKKINPTVFNNLNSVTIEVKSSGLSDKTTITKIVDGKYGYNAILSNDSHIFMGDTESVTPTKINVSIIGYKGSEKVPVRIESFTGVPTNGLVAVTLKNNNTTNASFDFEVKKGLVDGGKITFFISVDGVSITKEFSYAVSLEGKPAKFIQVTSSKPVVAFNNDNTPKDTDDLILDVSSSNLTDPITWTTNPSVTLGAVSGNSNQKTLAISNFTNNNSIEITVNSGDFSDVITIYKVLDGSGSINVVSTNEAHIFQGDVSTALASSTTTDILAYNGNEQVSCTIESITSTPTGMTTSISNNNTTKPTVNISVTSALTPLNGTININVLVGEVKFVKKFSYSVSFKGKPATYLELTSDSYAVGFTVDNTPKSSTAITLTANAQNVGNLTWSTTPSVTLGTVSGDSNKRTLAISNFTNNNSIKVTVSSGSFSDSVYIHKIQDGDFSYNIIMSNPSHVFAGDYDKAIASSTTCEIMAYKGTEKVNCTVGTITGTPTGMSTSITNNGTTNVSLKVSVTTSLTTKNGVLTIPVTVGGETINMKFSYALAMKGEWGTGVVSVTEEYATNTDKYTAPTSGWTATMPKWEAGKYLWCRTKIVYERPSSTKYSTPYVDMSWDAVTQVQDIELGGKNLLRCTAFKSNDNSVGWNIFESSKVVDGMGEVKAYQYNYTSSTGSKDILRQTIHDGTKKVLLPNKWYTFSFYVKGTGKVTTYLHPSLINTAQEGIVDGILKTLPSDGKCDWTASSTWTRHTVSFKTKSSISENESVLFRLFGATTQPNISICKPQLELGNKVSDWKQAEEDVELKVDTVITKQNDLIRTLDETKSTVSSHTNSISGLETKYSQIKQTADSVSSTVSNMKIGTRNLLRNTDFRQGSDLKANWNGNIESIRTKLTPGGNYSARILETGNTSNVWHGLSQIITTVPNNTLRNNTDYILSFYIWFDTAIDDQFGVEIKGVKSDGTHTSVQTYTWNSGHEDLETGTWLRFTVHFKFNTSTTNHYVYIWTRKNGTFYIGDMMLTEGNKYVPWVNATEDNREYAESRITQTANDITYEFKHSGAYPNLMPNGCPHWRTYSDTGWEGGNSGDGGIFNLYTNYSQLGWYSSNTAEVFMYSPWVSVSANTTYSLVFNLLYEGNCKGYDAFLLESDSSGNYTYTHLCNSDGVSSGSWKSYYKNITTKSSTTKMRIRFDNNGKVTADTNGGFLVQVTCVMVMKGADIKPRTWYPRTEEITSSTTVINGNGVNVRHNSGARTNLNATALNFYDTSNRLYSQVANGQYHFWYGDKYVGYLGHNGWVEDVNRRNVALSAEYDCLVALGAKQNSSDTSYPMFLAITGNDKTVGGTKYPRGVNMVNPHINGIIKMYSTANNSDTYPAQIFNNSGGQLILGGDNYADLCVMNGSSLCVGLRVAEDNSQSNHTAVRCYGPLSMNGYPTYASTMITPIDITSAQSYALRNADGDSYSDPTSETVTHLYAPKSTTDGEVRWTDRQTHHTSEWEDGIYESYIEIPWWVAESMELDYHVTITPVNGFYQYYVSERDPYYFIVRSDKEGMGFTFEINGKLLDNKTEGKNTSIASQQYNIVPEKSPDTISDVRIPVESTPVYPIEEEDSIQADIGEINTGE